MGLYVQAYMKVCVCVCVSIKAHVRVSIIPFPAPTKIPRKLSAAAMS